MLSKPSKADSSSGPSLTDFSEGQFVKLQEKISLAKENGIKIVLIVFADLNNDIQVSRFGNKNFLFVLVDNQNTDMDNVIIGDGFDIKTYEVIAHYLSGSFNYIASDWVSVVMNDQSGNTVKTAERDFIKIFYRLLSPGGIVELSNIIKYSDELFEDKIDGLS